MSGVRSERACARPGSSCWLAKGRWLTVLAVLIVSTPLVSCGQESPTLVEPSEARGESTGSAQGGASSIEPGAESTDSVPSVVAEPNGSETSGVTVYDSVPGLKQSPHYRFRVRALEGTWLDSFAWLTTCKDTDDNALNDRSYYKHLSGWSNTYTNFVMSEPVEVEIRRADGSPIVTAAAHPAHRVNSVAVRDGNAYVILPEPGLIAVDIDGQMDEQNTGRGAAGSVYSGPPIHTVTVFGNPPLDEPRLDDPGVVAVEPGEPPPVDPEEYEVLYFKPGVHELDRGFPLFAGKSYYIHGSAMVYGTFDSSHGGWSNGNNIRIYGHGTLSGARLAHPQYDTRPQSELVASMKAPHNPIFLSGAHDSTVEGITIADSAHHSLQMWASYDPDRPTTARWAKIFTWRANGDGIHPGPNMLVEDCFLRTQDDALYVEGVGMRRNVIWNDANGAAFILSSARARSLLIEDTDVIYARASWHKWSGGRVFSLRSMGTAGEVGGGDTVFRDIRITDPFQNFQTFMIYSKADYPETGTGDQPAGGGGLTGLSFVDITTAAPNALNYPEVLTGYADGPISQLSFDNVTIGGQPLAGLDDFSYVNEWVTDITFR